MPALRCGHCGREFSFEADDLNVDCEVERLGRSGVDVVITISLRCPHCNKRVLWSSESMTVPIRLVGELVERSRQT